MSRKNRTRGDRVAVIRRPGASEFDDANGTLPRSAYRDFEANLGDLPFDAVYLERDERGTGRRQMRSLFYVPFAKRVASPRNKRGATLAHWRFVTSGVSSRVGFCVKRKQRREVLHALRIAGKRGLRGSGRRGRMYKRSAASWYSCR